MARRKTVAPLRTGGFAWGQRRVELALSIRELSRRAGIDRGDLSRIERGRMIPTATEYQKVTAALEAWESERAVNQGRPADSTPDLSAVPAT